MNDLQTDVDVESGWNFLQWDFLTNKAEWWRVFHIYRRHQISNSKL